MTPEQRIAELECRQAFQDDTIQTLNDVVVGQGRQIDLLQSQMQLLIKRIEELQSAAEIDDEAPPHY